MMFAFVDFVMEFCYRNCLEFFWADFLRRPFVHKFGFACFCVLMFMVCVFAYFFVYFLFHVFFFAHLFDDHFLTNVYVLENLLSMTFESS